MKKDKLRKEVGESTKEVERERALCCGEGLQNTRTSLIGE